MSAPIEYRIQGMLDHKAPLEHPAWATLANEARAEIIKLRAQLRNTQMRLQQEGANVGFYEVVIVEMNKMWLKNDNTLGTRLGLLAEDIKLRQEEAINGIDNLS